MAKNPPIINATRKSEPKLIAVKRGKGFAIGYNGGPGIVAVSPLMAPEDCRELANEMILCHRACDGKHVLVERMRTAIVELLESHRTKRAVFAAKDFSYKAGDYPDAADAATDHWISALLANIPEQDK